VGSAAEGLGLFFLDAAEVDLQQKEKHNLAVITLLEEVNSKQIEKELTIWMGDELKWTWNTRPQGEK
jgi:hypothetical protein